MFCLLLKALIRDGFRCVISGQRSKGLELELKRDADAGVCYSQCAHIFPESTHAKISGNNATDKVYSFPIYLDVFLFFHPHLDVLAFIACGQSWNVLEIRRLWQADHDLWRRIFDTFRLWLEPVGTVSSSRLWVNWIFNWVSRTHWHLTPTVTNSVRLNLFISTRVGRPL